jgi:hypothetical protein
MSTMLIRLQDSIQERLSDTGQLCSKAERAEGRRGVRRREPVLFAQRTFQSSSVRCRALAARVAAAPPPSSVRWGPAALVVVRSDYVEILLAGTARRPQAGSATLGKGQRRTVFERRRSLDALAGSALAPRIAR